MSCFQQFRLTSDLYGEQATNDGLRNLADAAPRMLARSWHLDASGTGCKRLAGRFDDRTICLRVQPNGDHVLLELRVSVNRP